MARPAGGARVMADPNIQVAADRLFGAATSGLACQPVRDLFGNLSLHTAYAIQDINTRRALSAGRRQVGYKIGLTAKAVQKQLGVDQPDFGVLFADMAVPDGEPVEVTRLIAPRAEVEIAFVLSRDLDNADLTAAELMSGIAYAVPAIEIVDSRVADWKISILDTIADNASSGLFVLGGEPRKLQDIDMRLCGMVMTRGGEPISVGAGAACLGNPLNAVLWLAQKMAGLGRPMKAGDVILSGALGPMVAAKPGDVMIGRVEGLGSVRAVFDGSPAR